MPGRPERAALHGDGRCDSSLHQGLRRAKTVPTSQIATAVTVLQGRVLDGHTDCGNDPRLCPSAWEQNRNMAMGCRVMLHLSPEQGRKARLLRRLQFMHGVQKEAKAKAGRAIMSPASRAHCSDISKGFLDLRDQKDSKTWLSLLWGATEKETGA